MTDLIADNACLPCKGTQTRDWYSWNDLRPPLPDYFHLTGEVYVANPGVDPLLVTAEPQGINPRVLLLDLYLCQKSGIWPQVLVWKPVRFEKKISEGYEQVVIRCDGADVASVEVQDTH